MALVMSACYCLGPLLPAQAQDKKSETFSSRDDQTHKSVQAVNAVNAVAAAGAFAYDSADSPAKRWFEALDEKVLSYAKSEKENFILSRHFNQELERVQEWSHTAQTVAIKYKRLASVLRNLKTRPATKIWRNTAVCWRIIMMIQPLFMRTSPNPDHRLKRWRISKSSLL